MAATGTIELGGKQYAWESPKIKQLVTFEKVKGRLIGTGIIDTIDGVAYLAEACLRKNHPEMTAGIILDLPAQEFLNLRSMVLEAVPFWAGAAPGAASTDSSLKQPSDSDGSPAPSEESASPTS